MKQYVILAALSGCLVLSACTTTGTNSQAALNDETEQRTVQTREVVSGRDTVGMDDDEMICRRREVTGTRFKKVICRTWGEWKMIEEQSARNTKQMQDRMRPCVPGETC